MNQIKNWITIFLFQFLFLITQAQIYNVAGTAVPMTSPGCYRLTNTTSQSGAVWNINLINLNQLFDITLTLNFGNRPGTIGYVPATCGADGMSFVLQSVGNGVFGPGGGVGFAGITPSVGVVMDSYTANPTDPTYQHISINKNGDVMHGTTNELTPYTSAVGFPANITDGLDHLFRFVWLPSGGGNGLIMVYFGTATTLPTTPTITYIGNVVNTIFGGNPFVYWGVSGSTGGCWNTQYVCMTTISNFASAIDTCVGSPVNFTSTSISGLPITSYAWNFGDGGTSTAQNPIHTYSTPGTYSVSLTIINSGGFTNTNSRSIIIRPKPTVIVNDTSICYGDSAILIASGANTYSWSSGQLSSSISVSPPHDSTFIVTGKNSFGCTNKDTALVKVNPNPVIIIKDTSICYGDTATLNASGGSTYVWSTGSNISSTIVFPLQTTTYFVTVTDTLSCFSDTSVVVDILPFPNITVSNDTAICLGRTIQLEASGGISYAWSTGNQTNIISVSPVTDSTYFVTVTNSNGCKNDTDITVEILPPPLITISNDTTICDGNTIQIFASGGIIYNWNNGLQTDTILVTPNASKTYFVTVTTAGGCIGNAKINIDVVPNPTPNLTLSSDTICIGDAATISASGADLYHWNTGAFTQEITVQPTVTTMYSATFTNSTNGTNCVKTADINLGVKKCNHFYFPNAFTPDNDGLNDLFGPIGIFDFIDFYQLYIYDRWGNVIFKTSIPTDGWNGLLKGNLKALPGVYTYHVYIQETYSDRFELTGTVHLIR